MVLVRFVSSDIHDALERMLDLARRMSLTITHLSAEPLGTDGYAVVFGLAAADPDRMHTLLQRMAGTVGIGGLSIDHLPEGCLSVPTN